MATPQENLARFQEISNRGLQDRLPPEIRARFDEAVSRGLIQTQQPAQAQPATQQQMPQASQQQPMTRDQARESVYSGLAMQGQSYIDNAAEKQRQKEAQMAELRQRNPVLAQELENMNPFEAFLIGAGERTANLARGVGIMEPATPEEQQAFQDLKTVRPISTTTGQVIAEAAPWVVPGNQVANIATRAPRVLAGAGLGATEALVNARGEGVDEGQQIIRTLTGAGLGGLVAGLFPNSQTRVQREIQNTLERAAPSQQIDDIARVLDTSANPVDDIANIVSQQSDHPLVREIQQVVQNGGDDSANQIRTIINSARDAARDNRTAGYILRGSQLADDPAQREAIRQGFDEGLVTAIRGSTDDDVKQMNRMLNIFRQGRGNARYAAENRSSDIIGDSMMNRVNAVRTAANTARMQLGDIARNLKGQQVDLGPARLRLVRALEDAQVGFADDGTLNFAGSIYEDLPGPQSALNRIFNRLFRPDLDAFDAHNLKRFIDEQVNFGKQAEGLSGTAENLLKNVRYEINQSLRGISDEYGAVNDVLSQSIGALDNFQRAVGTTLDLDSPSAIAQLGTASRRILSNAQSRSRMIDSLADIQRLANKSGGNFNDDIITQVMFQDALERTFGPSARTSLAGEVAKGATDAARGRNLTDLVIDTASRSSDAIRGINEEAQIQALQNLLQR